MPLNGLDIAIGEADETENWLYKVRDAGFIDQKIAVERLKMVIEIEKMLRTLRRKIEANPESVRDLSGTYEE